MKGSLPHSAVVGLLVALLVFGVFVGLLALYPGLREKIEDAIGFMGQQLGVEEGTLYEGHALHVKLEPSSQEILEFHLTNQKKHQGTSDDYLQTFFIDSWYGKCVIFANKVYDQGITASYIYYIDPGAKIDNDCGVDLKECVEESIDAKDCDKISCHSDGEKFGVAACESGLGGIASGINCDDAEITLNADFGDGWVDKCTQGGGCPLLDSPNYRVKYGLICADDELWHACAEDGQEIGALGITYACVCSEEVEACWWEPSVYEECAPGAVVKGECIVCQLDGISRKPDDTVCENKYGTGYRCNAAGECVGPEAIPLSELVWMIGEGTCTAPTDWKMYILTNGTFITDFRERPCDNLKCMPDSKEIRHNSTWIGIHPWRQDIVVQIEDPVMGHLRRDRECLRGLVSCDSCTAYIKTESKDGEVRLIERTCKSLTVDNFETIWLNTYCDLMGSTRYWIIESGDFIKIMKSDKIYIEKICEAGQILPGTDCRVCNNQTVPFIENHTICQNEYGSDWYCLKGYCSGR